MSDFLRHKCSLSILSQHTQRYPSLPSIGPLLLFLFVNLLFTCYTYYLGFGIYSCLLVPVYLPTYISIESGIFIFSVIYLISCFLLFFMKEFIRADIQVHYFCFSSMSPGISLICFILYFFYVFQQYF